VIFLLLLQLLPVADSLRVVDAVNAVMLLRRLLCFSALKRKAYGSNSVQE
jgi:hypothetical protein